MAVYGNNVTTKVLLARLLIIYNNKRSPHSLERPPCHPYLLSRNLSFRIRPLQTSRCVSSQSSPLRAALPTPAPSRLGTSPRCRSTMRTKLQLRLLSLMLHRRIMAKCRSMDSAVLAMASGMVPQSKCHDCLNFRASLTISRCSEGTCHKQQQYYSQWFVQQVMLLQLSQS